MRLSGTNSPVTIAGTAQNAAMTIIAGRQAS